MRGQPRPSKTLYAIFVGQEEVEIVSKITEARKLGKAYAEQQDEKVFIVGYSRTDITEVK